VERTVDLTECIEKKVDEFQHNLRAQAELYRTLLGLAKRQTQEIADENMDAFVLLLEEKKKIVREIGEIELATIPLRQFWETYNEKVNEETRVKLRSVVNEIRTLLEELLKIESQSQQELGITKDMVEEELRQVGAGPKAVRSYRPRADSKPRFMDETG
jgi:hypothetical protein